MSFTVTYRENITITQTNNSKTGAGLFGHLTEEASLQDLTFENVTFTVKNGTRVAGTAYGLLAGSLSDAAAVENLTIRNGQLLIDSGCYFGVEDYSIGLLCGMGNAERVDYSDIRCSVVGDDPGRIRLQVSGNTITLEFVN